tara:strand:+ start:4912 stop:5160 length:249 start_codon:yes stop_codon:yes gene_type:complete
MKHEFDPFNGSVRQEGQWPMTDTQKIMDEWVQRIATGHYGAIEQRLRLTIRPKPGWLPRWAWARLVRWLLTIEQGPWRESAT